MSRQPKHLYEFGPFVLNPAEHTLLRDGQPVPLRPKVFDTLLVFVEHSGHLIEKEELMRTVWPGQHVEEGNLNKTVSMLRHALGENPSMHQYIETMPKLGYRFVADVRDVSGGGDTEPVVETRTQASLIVEGETDDEISAATGETRAADAFVIKPAMETATHVPARLAGESWQRLKRWMAPATAAVIIALAAIAYLSYPKSGGETIDSLAVLPFINESGDPEVEYISDGISESIINSLSQLPRLKITARSSAFKYKGKEIDIREAARSLGVKAILTGHVSRRGDNILVSVELVDARDNTHVWGEHYNRRESDLPAMQAEISREIAEALRLRLTAGEQRQIARRETANPQARELLLKGRFFRKKGATEHRKKAIEYVQQAIAIDPAYAPAYAELSSIYSGLLNNLLLDPKEFMPKAEEAARKALELDEGLGEAHLAMGKVKSALWDWAAAEREYKRAIELNPNLVEAHITYVYYLTIHGRDDEAIAAAKRARELDPLSYGANQAVVHGLMLAGQQDQAVEAATKMLELEPNNPDVHSLLGQVYARVGRYPKAIANYQEAIKLGDMSPDIQVALASVYAKAGERERARAILKRLETGKEYISPVGLAIIHANLGEQEQALALLERAYATHDQQLIWIGVERRFSFASINSDPRFQDLMRRVGLTTN